MPFQFQQLTDLIRAKAKSHAGRFMVAIAGPPASGKSTLAADLVTALGPGARVVPMDGFHFDDAILTARGHQSRKGAPHTFDVAGLSHTLTRIRDGQEVAIPVFDRSLELARAGADVVGQADRIIVVEGNYLLLNEVPWPDLAPLFDLTIWIDVPEAELDRRLLARWAHYGKTPAEARAWIDGNDMPNIRRVTQGSRPADLTIHQV